MDALRLLGGLLGNNATGGGIGGALLEGILGGGKGGGAGGAGGVAGALGGILGGAQQGGQQGGQQSGAGGLLGSLLGGGQQDAQSQGGQQGGGLLGGLVSGALSQHAQQQGGGMADALGGLLGGGASAAAPANPLEGMKQQEVTDGATLLIRAMCNAAKADGQIDQQEQQNIVGRLGDSVGQDEMTFLRNELQSPLDVDGFVRQVPQNMQQQVYAMSVMAINVDTQSEAKYLGQLAQGFGMDGPTCNQIHSQLGAPEIFS